MAFRCPGQDRRFWTPKDVYDHPCPHCGESIEFFRDDIALRCPQCKNKIANPKLDLGCASWCDYAEQCLGQLARTYQQRPEALRHRLEVAVRKRLSQDGKKSQLLTRALRHLDKALPDSEGEVLCLVGACLLLPVAEAAEEIMEEVEFPEESRREILSLVAQLESGQAAGPLARTIARAYISAQTELGDPCEP